MGCDLLYMCLIAKNKEKSKRRNSRVILILLKESELIEFGQQSHKSGHPVAYSCLNICGGKG